MTIVEQELRRFESGARYPWDERNGKTKNGVIEQLKRYSKRARHEHCFHVCFRPTHNFYSGPLSVAARIAPSPPASCHQHDYAVRISIRPNNVMPAYLRAYTWVLNTRRRMRVAFPKKMAICGSCVRLDRCQSARGRGPLFFFLFYYFSFLPTGQNSAYSIHAYLYL